ncbi:O-antigen ligase family protein [Candidatus Pelagibacter sp.]|nr:O-antigen ligase family protein [Candidatus Pelagibacter sp.]
MILVIVILDLIFEFFMGKNIFGQNSIMQGRLSSFTGEESVVGHFVLGFCLIFLSSKYQLSKNIISNFLLAMFLIILAFLIGERSNFIRISIIIIIFGYFVYNLNIKTKILAILSFLILFFSIFLFLSDQYKWRYYNHLELLFTKNGYIKYLDDSQYGAHRNVAKEIFLDNPIFGVGIKNFRVESANKKYDDLEHKRNYLRVSNHPHELYYEFLSETGLFGLVCFLIFILTSIILSFKSFTQNKNIYQFSALLVVIVSILPILPTGSFFATYSSSIFWINYAIMMGYCDLKKF